MRNAKGEGFFSDSDRIRKASENIPYTQNIDNSPYRQYELLKIFFNNKIPMYFINSFELYTDMLIQKLHINRDASNEGRIEVEITLQQVKFAEMPQVYFVQAEKVKEAKGMTKKVQLVPSKFCVSDPMINLPSGLPELNFDRIMSAKDTVIGDMMSAKDSLTSNLTSNFMSAKDTAMSNINSAKNVVADNIQQHKSSFSLDGLNVDNLSANLQNTLLSDYQKQLAIAKNLNPHLSEEVFNEFMRLKWQESHNLNISQQSISDKFSNLSTTVKNTTREYYDKRH